MLWQTLSGIISRVSQFDTVFLEQYPPPRDSACATKNLALGHNARQPMTDNSYASCFSIPNVGVIVYLREGSPSEAN